VGFVQRKALQGGEQQCREPGQRDEEQAAPSRSEIGVGQQAQPPLPPVERTQRPK